MENRNTKILENLKKEINLLASDMEKQDAAEFYSELADEGMISVNRREIIILDREKMRGALN